MHKQSLYDFCMQNSEFVYLLEEWDYNLNESSPKEIAHFSTNKYNWVCSKGHSYLDSLHNRIVGTKCPYCINKYFKEGYNDLETWCKENNRIDLLNEWDYDRNRLKPNEVKAGGRKKYFWNCGKHFWEQSIQDRKKNTGCIYCNHYRVWTYDEQGRNDFAFEFPEMLKEWDYEENDKLDIYPNKILGGSRKRVNWICENGHKWQQSLSIRTRLGTGCPKCSYQSSVPEIALYLVLAENFSNVLHRVKKGSYEFDIFLEDLNIAIEYDGITYHIEDVKKTVDLKKTLFARASGINLIRIIEYYDDDIPENIENSKYQMFISRMNAKNIEYLCESFVEFLNEYWGFNIENINLVNIRQRALSYRSKEKEDNSIYYTRPELVKDWDYENNGNLTPKKVTQGQDIPINWVCHKCGFKWSAYLNSRSRGIGCPACVHKKLYSGFNDFETWCKENNQKFLLEEWDYDKNMLKPNEVISSGGINKFFWICPKGHSYEMELYSRKKGRGCPYCANKKLIKGETDLKSVKPNLIKYWDFESNEKLGIKFEDLSVHSNKKVYWKCLANKGHPLIYVSPSQIRGDTPACKYCSNNSVWKGDNDLETKYPEVLVDWDYEKNQKKPYEYVSESGKKVYWKCHICGNEWKEEVYLAIRHEYTGCKKCRREQKRKLK